MPNERGTSGSARDPRKPTGASRHGAECLLYVRRENSGKTDDLKIQPGVILVRVGPDVEGGRERRWRLAQRPAKAERSELPALGGLPQVPWRSLAEVGARRLG